MKEYATKEQLVLNPQLVVTDFELAMIKCIRSHYPNAVVKGSNFHFNQCINKNIGTLLFEKIYNSNEKFRFWVKKLMAFAFIQEDKLSEAIRKETRVKRD